MVGSAFLLWCVGVVGWFFVVLWGFVWCDQQLNELDATIGDMLRKGAQVDLTENQLTLATADKTLMFKRAD